MKERYSSQIQMDTIATKFCIPMPMESIGVHFGQPRPAGEHDAVGTMSFSFTVEV